jgi:pSer/pThr/pTyr-binding forkhead associated (FHA) protein
LAAYLVDVDSSDQYLVTEPTCTIGADASSDIVIAAEKVLPKHISIESREDGLWAALVPGATNTSKFLLLFDVPTASVNGQKLHGKQVQIVHGDRLKVGSRLLQLSII